ncbi:MAG: oxidoreductase [Gammaproteobacteria bacterium]|nr:oxidoreductase [Gammaproteobacteria bacterium]MBU0786432.1 oxidoreductase [Gammaproteobacteria bacterium]MBU0816135.1 oxidoreductase [Gammaproteobacteria bacterium]MBU1787839.1 oxidoreductase [Gammaproteobacteria bacterium]
MTESPHKIAALLGASGATGRRLLPLLLSDPAYSKVITLSRRATGISHEKLDERIVDFDDLAAGLRGVSVDDCYCTFGTTIKIAGSEEAMTRIDHGYVMAFAAWGLAAGAKRFAYLSAANANAGSSVFYARLKGQTEEALKALGFADLSIFRPSMIIAQRDNRRWAESLLFPLLPILDKLMIGAFTQYRSIPVETLAKAIAAFSTQSGSGYQTHYWQDMQQAGRDRKQVLH